MKARASLEGILGDFEPRVAGEKQRLRRPVTIWLTPEDHARWKELQKLSERQFIQKARETILALMDLAEARSA